AKDVENDRYYRSGDYTGDLGVEKSYEKYLRGVKGVEILMKDALGRIKGKYEDGVHDVIPVAGKDLTLSIDMDLQEYGEQLMRGKIGAIVAIEPKTGEILCMVSSPTYDPSLLVGSDRGRNYATLVADKYKPLYDRALQGAYPPGSTFKPTQGLIFLQEGTITPATMYPCYHGYVNGLRVGCHSHGSPIALKPAIATSCNAYFCWGFKNFIDKRGTTPTNQFEKWKNYMVEMGYGYKLGVDLPSESRGFIPNPDFYSKSFRGKNWSANSIISVSIGQGEVLATPLQIANLASTIANRGWFITPHVVKEVSDTVLDPLYKEKRQPSIKKEYYEQIAEGMRGAVIGGTCRLANLPGLEVCGKTGTAQNPHGKDHSAFMGFAPYNDPKIAVAVYVENAGFGATYGVPIGSLIIEKYLKGSISPERKYLEERMLNSNTIITSGVKKH
ncbi:MAG: penicillin-binding protein 2, partial [Muribaculaceae bacterium]|nr:penicillin-binding protein 2 [Muribaculaceae bacterium]